MSLENSPTLQAERIVERQFLLQESQEAIVKAEKVRKHESKTCYCIACCKRVVEDANNAIWSVLETNPDEKLKEELFEKYRYHVIMNGRNSKVANFDEYEDWKLSMNYRDNKNNESRPQVGL